MNVLVTSASRKVGLVRAFKRATAAVGDGRVVAVDISPLAAALYEADVARLVPPSRDPAFLDAILDICASEEVGLLIPTRDEELPVFAEARGRFAALGVLALVPESATVATCQDKSAFASACSAAGLSTPRVVLDPSDRDLPVFIRPRTAKGGQGARAVRSRRDLGAALEELGPSAFIQELIEAPEFTVDLFVDPRDGTPISCVPRERVVVVDGESQIGRTVRDDRLRDATLRLAAALGLTGHVTVQAFRRGDEVLFIEVNPRYGGGASLGFAAGAPTPEFAVRIARGERIEPRLDAYEAGLSMLRFSDDRILRDTELVSSTEAR
jgi:carbamoyl-phosphate synthase large subunit